MPYMNQLPGRRIGPGAGPSRRLGPPQSPRGRRRRGFMPPNPTPGPAPRPGPDDEMQGERLADPAPGLRELLRQRFARFTDQEDRPMDAARFGGAERFFTNRGYSLGDDDTVGYDPANIDFARLFDRTPRSEWEQRVGLEPENDRRNDWNRQDRIGRTGGRRGDDRRNDWRRQDRIGRTGGGGGGGGGGRDPRRDDGGPPNPDPGLPPSPNIPPPPGLEGLPLDPFFEAGRRSLEDEMTGRLASIAGLRGQLGPERDLALARIGTNEGIDRRQLDEGLAGRGVFESGIRTRDQGMLGTQYLRTRQDLANDFGQRTAGLANQEADVRGGYQRGLMELLMDLANRQAQSPYAPTPRREFPRDDREPPPYPKPRRRRRR